MVYEDYETNKTITRDHLGRKALIYGDSSSIHTKSQLIGAINLLLRNRGNGLPLSDFTTMCSLPSFPNIQNKPMSR